MHTCIVVTSSQLAIGHILPHPLSCTHHCSSLRPSPPSAAATLRRSIPYKPHHHFSLKSHQTSTPNLQPTTSPAAEDFYADDDGIPIEHVKILAKFKSRHNYIRVLQVSRSADHPLAGSRLLLLDAPGNIHSISFLFKSLTNAYYDVFATLTPILPPGPVAILGFGAGSAAKLILELHPETTIHGFELDPSVISVAREYFGLDLIERKYADRLFIHIGNALNAEIKDGFAGMLVDLFSKGCVIPELQNPATWEKLKKGLRRGGRIMVNVGGSCVEPEDIRKDGRLIMEETLKAMSEVFPDGVSVLSLDNRKDDSSVALTGKLPDVNKWKKVLKKPLKFYVDMWEPYRRRPLHTD